MGITKLFSMRQKEDRGEYPDVYVYNKLPTELRRQVIHILTDHLGGTYNRDGYTDNSKYQAIYNMLCREYGLFELDNTNPKSYSYNKIQQFFLNAKNIEQALDVIELCFISVNDNNNPEYALRAINELNTRFKMHGVGYEFVGDQIIRIDSELTHQEIIKPTLGFLRDKKHFIGANEEFLKAHEFYRNKQYKEAMTECAKAFESTLKSICQKRGWQYNPTATAKSLIQTCLDNGLVPSYMQEHLTQLRVLLETTVTPRNKESAHGQGTEIKNVPEELASYTLHLTASNILFLVECEKKLV